MTEPDARASLRARLLLEEWDAEVAEHGIWTSGHAIAARMAAALREVDREAADALVQPEPQNAEIQSRIDGERIEQYEQQIAALTRERDEAIADGWCDVCAGTGKPTSGVPCMCGGTGKAAMAVVYLRERLTVLQHERDEYKTLAAIGTWHKDCRPNREMAARELQKSQAIIDKLADTISTLQARLTVLEAQDGVRNEAFRICQYAIATIEGALRLAREGKLSESTLQFALSDLNRLAALLVSSSPAANTEQPIHSAPNVQRFQCHQCGHGFEGEPKTATVGGIPARTWFFCCNECLARWYQGDMGGSSETPTEHA